MLSCRSIGRAGSDDRAHRDRLGGGGLLLVSGLLLDSIGGNMEQELAHFGIKGMHWGVRRFQQPDGTLTSAGKKRRFPTATSLQTLLRCRGHNRGTGRHSRIGQCDRPEPHRPDGAEQAPAARNDILAKRFGLPMEGYTYYFTYEETLPHRRRDFSAPLRAFSAHPKERIPFLRPE